MNNNTNVKNNSNNNIDNDNDLIIKMVTKQIIIILNLQPKDSLGLDARKPQHLL